MDFFIAVSYDQSTLPQMVIRRIRDGQYWSQINLAYQATPFANDNTNIPASALLAFDMSGMSEDEHMISLIDFSTNIPYGTWVIGTGLLVKNSDQSLDAIAERFFTKAPGVDAVTTLREAMQWMTAVLLGKNTGPAPGVAGHVVFRNIIDTIDQVDATVNANGYRTLVSKS